MNSGLSVKINKTNSLGERAVKIVCESHSLLGILHNTEKFTDAGVLMYSGGYQTRIGPHRKFVKLARAISKSGISVFRFEPRGLGDSEGTVSDVESLENDIKCALDAFHAEYNSLKNVIIVSMCDGASVSLHYADSDSRIAALVLINPWISRSDHDTTLSIKKYYIDRLLSIGFWPSVIKRRKAYSKMLVSVLKSFNHLIQFQKYDLNTTDSQTIKQYYCFDGSVALMLSGNDIVAAEFQTAMSQSGLHYRSKCIESRRLIAKFPHADHTFSDKHSYMELETAIVDWLHSKATCQTKSSSGSE